jgi:hypothetical protein
MLLWGWLGSALTMLIIHKAYRRRVARGSTCAERRRRRRPPLTPRARLTHSVRAHYATPSRGRPLAQQLTHGAGVPTLARRRAATPEPARRDRALPNPRDWPSHSFARRALRAETRKSELCVDACGFRSVGCRWLRPPDEETQAGHHENIRVFEVPARRRVKVRVGPPVPAR